MAIQTQVNVKKAYETMQELLLERPKSLFSGEESVEQLKEAINRGGQTRNEIILDFETTSRTPWFPEPKPGAKIGQTWTATQYGKKWGCGFNKAPRARVLTISLPELDFLTVADLDLLTPDEKYRMAGLLDGHVWVGHNLLFDYQWMLSLNPDVKPARIVDTMLMVTSLRPDAMYEMQKLIVQQTLCGLDTKRKHFKELEARTKKRVSSKDMSDGSMSLDDLALWLFDEKLDKAYQKPINWMPEFLSDAHYAYCKGDVETPRKAARVLLDLPHETSIEDVLLTIDKRRGGTAYKDMEAVLHVLVRMQRKGLYWSPEKAKKLSEALEVEAIEAMDKLELVSPNLKPFREQILSTGEGLDDALKNAIGVAIRRETGQDLPTTAKGNTSLNANDLKLAFPDSKVVAALKNTLNPVSERKKIPQYASSVAVDGRIHPLTGINTVTGRTSSQIPNLQNIPRDPRFRAIFTAPTGYKIIATDFSSIELRIAAALGVRAWRVLHGIVAGIRGDERMHKALDQQIKRVGWIMKAVPELMGFIEHPERPIPERIAKANPTPDIQENPTIETWALAAAHQLCIILKKINTLSGGDESLLPFRLAYNKRLDPHIITALKMEAQGGRFDLKGLSPIAYLETLTPEEQSALKKTMKGPRQAAKAVGFGLIYGMSSDSLWAYGVQSYGLSWFKKDAADAKEAYFDIFPEMGLWHWVLKNAFKIKADILNPYNSSECRAASEGGKLYAWYTLSGRPTIAAKITSGANYQDQGTGAEIAFRALRMLPADIQDYVINFVHDEIIVETPEHRTAEVQSILEKTMIAAADSLLLKYGIPTEVESAIGDCWIH